MPPVEKKFPTVFIIGGILAALLGALAFYYFMSPDSTTPPPATPAPTGEKAVTPPAPEESLGASLYEKSNNSVGAKIPEQSSGANPMNDAYKNPFE